MPIPDHLKIRSHTYKLVSAPDNQLRSEEAQGLCDSLRNVITYAAEAPKSRQYETIIHEVLHAGLAGHNFSDEEAIVVILGEILTQFIQDNPAFVRLVMKG